MLEIDVDHRLITDARTLLEDLIRIESFSKAEDATAALLNRFLRQSGIETERSANNVWAENLHFDADKPTILLNSHHDTVRPNNSWSLDPFEPSETDGKLFGLGSNDAGCALVSLIAAFRYFYARDDLGFNLKIATTAEEEISGRGGVESILDALGKFDLAVVGEPTEMEMAVAEKGLMVLDCVAHGKSGHAARDIGVNAIESAIRDIGWFHSYRFARESETLGPVKMTVTIIEAGTQHNVVPERCAFTVDVRTTDAYSNQEVLMLIMEQVESDVTARSTRLNSSQVPPDHPVVQAADQLNIVRFGSATTSDQAVIPGPSIKMGPGKSERSHTADEFIYLAELEQGVRGYIDLLTKMNEIMKH